MLRPKNYLFLVVAAASSLLYADTRIKSQSPWLASGYDFLNKSSLQPKSAEKEKVQVKWTGNITNTSSFNINTSLLNNDLPDKTSWARTILHLGFNSTFGQKTYGHEAARLEATFRHKIFWGADALASERETVRIGNAVTGSHSHPFSKPALWVYSLKLDCSLDAFSGKMSRGLNRFCVGFFPFSLGRGIALGENYGVAQDALGVLIKSNDFVPPGIMLYGELPNELFEYQLYYSRPEAKSASPRQTLAITKEHWINAPDVPFGGAFKDDHIVAAQLTLKAGKPGKNLASFRLQPYGFSFWGNDKTIDVGPDSNFNLITGGCAGEFTLGCLEIGFDAAGNFGHQEMHEVDKNKLSLQVDSSAATHTEVLDQIVNDADDSNALASQALLAELLNNQHRDGAVFTVDGQDYRSKSGRIRSAYKNNYRGYMAVGDVSLGSKKLGTRLSAIAGYASGDGNPHTQKVDKDYDGFVGINEVYSSKRVPSMIILGGASVKRPLALDFTAENQPAKLKDFTQGAFTDLQFAGGGFSLDLTPISSLKGQFMVNALSFWKEKAGNKVVLNESDEYVISGDKASKHLGVELNSIFRFELMEHVDYSLKGAVFFPGQYYKDIEGAQLDDALTKRLAKLDQDKASTAKDLYRMKSDTCWFVASEIKFSF